MDKDKQVVLERILDLLKTIGSANDAEDHGFIYDAERMRSESCKALYDLIREYEYLTDLLPTLQEEMDSKRILWVGWVELSSKVEGILRSIKED